ncbi:MAG: hypothetical protein QNL04_12205 [SAR324 cluster bacterium]|nr:hypothetical protein [SAR324 cluster bacterium]
MNDTATENPNKKFTPLKGLAIFMFIFGLLTVKSGGGVLFVDSIREVAGNYILPIVWFNFLAGALSLLVAPSLWLGKVWAPKVASAVFFAYLAMDLYLAVHIVTGGMYMEKTILAMAIRTTMWGLAGFLGGNKEIE